VPTKERLAAIGATRGRALVAQLARDLREARLAAGLSQSVVAAAAGLSQETISRYELAQPPYPDLLQAARVAAVLGLDLRAQTYPGGAQLRDAAHATVIGRFLARVPSTVRRQLEAPVRRGDLRAWDVLLVVDGVRIGVIAETRIRDLQALLRREHRKQVDGGIDRLVMLVADTRHNARALDEAGIALREQFPLGTRALMVALSRGSAPAANGIVVR
jgi:transcriptional regulator with XRE-family HTH domain